MTNYGFTNLIHIISNVLSHGKEAVSGGQASNSVQSKMPLSTNIIMGVIVYGALIIFLFVLPSRNRKKKELEVKKMHDNISVGDSVLVTSGLYGKIVDIYEDLYVVEFGINKSVRIPINKYDVLQVKEPALNSVQKDKNNQEV